jgi:hypothetical protein
MRDPNPKGNLPVPPNHISIFSIGPSTGAVILGFAGHLLLGEFSIVPSDGRSTAIQTATSFGLFLRNTLAHGHTVVGAGHSKLPWQSVS